MVRKVLLVFFSITLALSLAAPASADVTLPPVCEASDDTDLPIPDLSSVESRLTLTGCYGVTFGTLTIHIYHPRPTDLRLLLVTPDNTFNYFTPGTSPGPEVHLTLGLAVAPGATPNGTWLLRITDITAGETGYLDYWSISFGY